MRTVSLLDLKAEYDLFRDDVRDAVERVLESQHFVGGPAIAELEESLRTRIGVRDAIAVSSGTDGLLCALMALGVGVGDDVIVPSFTFFGTGGVVSRLGAKPVFVDVDGRTFNIDPARVAEAITDRTKAIIAVHLFGQCADVDALRAIAGARGIPLVEDACQSIEATLRGVPAGALGDVACFSFYPTKNLGGFGEGGLITTNDMGLGAAARRLRHHGASGRYQHERVGGNFRLDTMKAAILNVKLSRLSDFTSRRRANALRYDGLLSDLPVQTPAVGDGCTHVYHQYSILCDRRDELSDFLGDRGVATAVYYPLGLHRQPCFAADGRSVSLPVTDHLCGRILSLPCHPMLADEDVVYTAKMIRAFFGETAAQKGERASARTRGA